MREGVVTPDEYANAMNRVADADNPKHNRWSCIGSVLLIHASEHYSAPSPSCRQNPCKAAGVSFALMELQTFYMEFTSNLPTVAVSLSDFGVRLQALHAIGERVRLRAEPMASALSNVT